MSDVFAEALLNYLTPVTMLVVLFLPSLWASAAVGVTAAMVGVIFYVDVQPNSQLVAAWLIAQTAIALGTSLMRKSWR